MTRPPGFERTPAYRLAKRTTPKRLAKDARVDAEWRANWEWEFGGGKQRYAAEQAAWIEALKPLMEDLGNSIHDVLTQRSVEMRLLDIKR